MERILKCSVLVWPGPVQECRQLAALSSAYTQEQKQTHIAHILFTVGGTYRRKIRLIESKDKCCYLKKLTCKGTLRQVFYLSETFSPPMTPYSPPYTHNTCIHYTVILVHTGKGGGELTREKVRWAKVHKAGSKIPTWLTNCISSL